MQRLINCCDVKSEQVKVPLRPCLVVTESDGHRRFHRLRVIKGNLVAICHIALPPKSASLIEIAELGRGPLNQSHNVSPVSYTPDSPKLIQNEWAVTKVALWQVFIVEDDLYTMLLGYSNNGWKIKFPNCFKQVKMLDTFII